MKETSTIKNGPGTSFALTVYSFKKKEVELTTDNDKRQSTYSQEREEKQKIQRNTIWADATPDDDNVDNIGDVRYILQSKMSNIQQKNRRNQFSLIL